MLLLYRFPESDRLWYFWNLHSIMLLLYPIMASYEHVDFLLFTFHYASTLSCTELENAWFGRNLHSIMLLLYRSRVQRTGYFSKIYIPLCFYFIGAFGRWWNLQTINLHSIMLLLYRIRDCGTVCKDIIYIPLCFYFISQISISIT